MKLISANAIFRRPYFFALLSGLILAISFPRWSVAGFAWIAPGLILFCGKTQCGRKRFWIGYSAGLAHFLFSLNWLLAIPFPAGAVAGWLALSAYLSVYPAIWVWLGWGILEKFSRNSTEQKFSATTWKQRAIWSLSCAVVWVAWEMAMARVISGFPWNFLGITQYRLSPLIQIASVTGVYGVSFLLVWFSVSLCSAGMLLIEQPQNRRVWLGEIFLPAFAVAILFAWGANRIAQSESSGRTIKVALVQPSIPQTLIFDPSQNENRLGKIFKLSELALAEKPDLLIWPEASTPTLDEDNFLALTNLVARGGAWMIFGADDGEIRSRPQGGLETNYYNSSFLFAPDGNAAATYRKQRLVIFGEYIPLARWMPFMKWFTPIEGGFTPGEGPVQFRIASPRAKIAPLICFEDAFPHYAREHVDGDTDFLLNLTNDGWFGERSAQWQQAANAFFRAVENGLPIVRCTNNGLTCWADKFGRMRGYFGKQSGDVYGAGFLIADIPLLGENEKRTATFYRKHGDWFGWSCVVVSGGLLVLSRRKRPLTVTPR